MGNLFPLPCTRCPFKKIQSYELKDDLELGDLVYWRNGNKGKFSIKSTFCIMRNERDSINDECWKFVWVALV